MADLSYIQATMETKIVGQDSTGNNANFVSADANGNMNVVDYADGPVTPGTVAAKSGLIGGQYNSILPTLTNGQQAAIQVDSSGRIIVSPVAGGASVLVTNLPTTVDTNYGMVGINTIRTAAQIGNATGAADFGTGATSAQTLRVKANQGAPEVVSNAWPIRITDGVSAITAAISAYGTVPTGTEVMGVNAFITNVPAVSQSGAWNITNISGTISLPTGASTSTLQTIGNTSLATIVTALTLAQASTTSGQTGALTLAAVTTNPPLYATGQTDPLSLTVDGDLRTADIINTSSQYRAQSVTTTAAEALGAATILANRKMLSVCPTNGTIWWGTSAGVTITTGTPIFKNTPAEFAFGANVHIYIICASGTVDCRIVEGS